eukprot:scaffold40476_cov68-Phaeocystis_antarctica.AAC.1
MRMVTSSSSPTQTMSGRDDEQTISSAQAELDSNAHADYRLGETVGGSPSRLEAEFASEEPLKLGARLLAHTLCGRQAELELMKVEVLGAQCHQCHSTALGDELVPKVGRCDVIGLVACCSHHPYLGCDDEANGREVHYMMTRGERRNVHCHEAEVVVLGQPRAAGPTRTAREASELEAALPHWQDELVHVGPKVGVRDHHALGIAS